MRTPMTDLILRTAAAIVVGGFLLAAPTASMAKGECGVPTTAGPNPLATDAQTILRDAVALPTDCDDKPCVCDVLAPTGITASDAAERRPARLCSK